jgi:hypothetical protein
LIYERNIAAHMAKGQQSGDKGKRPKKVDFAKNYKIGGASVKSSTEEVTALRAFLISFVLFSLFIAPVIGLAFYFARDVGAVTSVFSNRELTFIGGMLLGILVAFVMSIVFTRKAVAQT